jgi:paraquat-inducible protein B
MSAVSGKPHEPQGDRQAPLILDLGKKKRKSVKQLRNGKGKLLAEALDSIEELQRVGTIPKSAQPVILIVRERPKSNMFSILGS